MRIAVMGAGAVGGYFGARLAAAGNEVWFISRGERLKAYRTTGIRVESIDGDLEVVPLRATKDPSSIGPVDLVLCDLRMPGMDGMELLPQIGRRLPGATVIMMSAYGTADLAIEAMKRGAYDYLAKPFQPSEVLLTIRKARERERLRRANALLQRDVDRAVGERPIVAASPVMIEVLELLERAAEFKATVLLTGESGTGKGLVARVIHEASSRREGVFVEANCVVYSEGVLHSELFGHERGAFTGAARTKKGRFELAQGGALFLGTVAVLPFFARHATNVQVLQLSSTGMLIVVGVVLDTMKQLEAQLLMRHYQGFIR